METQKSKEKEESIIEHIEALRLAVLNSLCGLSICIIPMFFVAPYALKLFLKIILKDNNIALNYFSPVEVFLVQIKMALILALIVSFPYIAREVWKFFAPALYENERKFISSIVWISSVLFILGSLFCLFIILPLIINFGLSFQSTNIQPVLGITNVVNLSLWLILSFGIMFQMPLVTHSLIKSGIISYNTIRDKRPYVVVGILIIAAILTPPDIISQIMLFAPTYLLFELGLLFSRNSKGQENE